MGTLRISLIWIGLFLAALIVTSGATQAQDTASRRHDELVALEKRLADSGCYKGAFDGNASASLDAAVKACPSQDPVLRIETGMHTAVIQHIAVDASCHTVVTASPDKTVRVWSTDGKLSYTQRLPIGDGFSGQIFATAITPDGTLVAAGGYDASGFYDSPIYLFDAATGQNLRRLGKTGGAIEAIAFSSDGKRVASGGGGGIHIFDVESGRELMSDPHVSRYSYGVAFGPDGSLYATIGEDGLLRRYGPDGQLQKVVRTKGGKIPYSLAIDPSGRHVAVGFMDTKTVEFYDAETLRHVGFADTRDIKSGSFLAVSWSRDGNMLFAGGDAKEKFGGVLKQIIRRFTATGQKIGTDSPVADNSVEDLAACGDGVAFAAADPLFGLLHADGSGTVLQHGHVADMRLKLQDAFTVSDDGTRVRFGLSIGNADPVLFDLLGGQVTPAPLPLPDLTPADAAVGKLHLAGRFAFAPGDVLRSMAIRPDGAGFALGTSFFLMSIDARNMQLRWSKQAPGEATGANLARSGNLVIMAYDDGTIRWHRWSDGKELLAVLIDTQSKRWVAWTPTGYYMASAGGEDLIGWHVNRSWNQTADFFPASRFRARFNRPDIVRLVLKTLDEGAAVEQANETARRREDTKPLVAQLPPVIRIVAPTGGSQVTTGEVTIDYAWRSPSGQPVDQITVLVNHRTVKTKGLPVHWPEQDAETSGSITMPLNDRSNEVGLIAWSGDMSSQVASVKIEWNGAPATVSQDRKLYAVIVGISNYADAAMSLGFAAKDAGDFAKALDNQKGGYYGDVQTRLITDRAATRESIVEGLEWLETNVTRKDDVGVLFLAGHGVTDDKQDYWFLPADATEDNFRFKGVSQDEMRRSLQTLPGKALWFLDTCHAGGATKRPVDINVLVNTVTAPENGSIVTFASSTGSELSEERPDWHNGAFTKAIVEGIEDGQAAHSKDGSIMTFSLETYLEDRVQELTAGKQHPVLGWPPGEKNFVIAQKGEHPQK